jgi:hypothetical protein
MASDWRIITDGLRFRIQRRRSFWRWSWWSTFPDLHYGPWETENRAKAEELVARFREEELARERGWREVETKRQGGQDGE